MTHIKYTSPAKMAYKITSFFEKLNETVSIETEQRISMSKGVKKQAISSVSLPSVSSSEKIYMFISTDL